MAASTAARQRMLARVAWLYYNDGLTQQEIGDHLKLSRIKVNRLLAQARAEGIVQITITAPEGLHIDLEQALCSRFGLLEAAVVDAVDSGDPQARYTALAQGAAEWLAPRLASGMCIGLGMSRTILHLPDFFEPEGPVDCTFTEVIGGASDHNGLQIYNITSRMAELAGGRPGYIFAPTVISSVETCQRLLREPPIAAALERARACDMIIQSVGTVDESALLVMYGYLSAADLDDLRARGAVGDMLGRYFDSSGQPVRQPLEDRIIGLTLEDLKAVPCNVIVAGGPEKVPVLKAALRGGLFNILVTDVQSARLLLED